MVPELLLNLGSGSRAISCMLFRQEWSCGESSGKKHTVSSTRTEQLGYSDRALQLSFTLRSLPTPLLVRSLTLTPARPLLSGTIAGQTTPSWGRSRTAYSTASLVLESSQPVSSGFRTLSPTDAWLRWWLGRSGNAVQCRAYSWGRRP